MEKVLRSLLHEKFDLDLRVEIEFLSRRRDLVNEEKQEEIIKLLQSRDISGIVPLGPGTNRYAFKLDGFVIKVATDHDGKIDNLKEFKMAKRLYPYVSKTYEVSENGTLLVAEYIQPFETYTEMCKHADRIREILEQLSSVYLIGDVGITPNNFANWGLRVGTQDPVCLDFAYVYEVSSKLFLCRYCTAHAMLVPNKDFTELHCSNPACGRKYLFEDIRSMIGNDIHNHEIGDLSDEGYKLFSSGVKTELTDSRSNYLLKTKKAVKEVKQEVAEEPPFEDNFVVTEPLDIIKGGNTMSRIEDAMKVAAVLPKPAPGTVRIQATVIPGSFTPTSPAATPVVAQTQVISDPKVPEIPEAEKDGATISGLTGGAVVINDGHEDGGAEMHVPVVEATVKSTLAFQGHMTGDPEEEQASDPMPVPGTQNKRVYATLPGGPTPMCEPKPVEVTASINMPPVPTNVEATVTPKDDPTPTAPEKHQFEQGFIAAMRDVISRLSNQVGRQMYLDEIYEEVQTSIRDKKMYRETFYENCQSAVFRSLVKFLNFTEEVRPKTNGRGTRKLFFPPVDLNEHYEPTLIFLERIWKNKFFDKYPQDKSTEMMAEYRRIYSDYQGIQPEWLEELSSRISAKMPIDVFGAKKIAELLAPLWCAPETSDEEDDDPLDIGISDKTIEVAVRNIFDAPNNDGAEEFITDLIDDEDGVLGDTSKRFIIEALNQFGVKHFGTPLADFIEENMLILTFTVTAANTSWTFTRWLDTNEMRVYDVVMSDPRNVLSEQRFTSITDLIKYLAQLDVNEVVKFYTQRVNDILARHMQKQVANNDKVAKNSMYGSIGPSNITPAEAAAQILGMAARDDDEDEEEEDDEQEEYQTLAVRIYHDGDFDIIKVTSGEAFGPVSIPFYTNLSTVSLDTGCPSLIDDRNGVWDWMTHTVPDLMFRTTDPDKYMAENDLDLGPDQGKILILDNDHGTYTMGIYWLTGIFLVDSEGNDVPFYEKEALAKINRVIREDIGYTRISHLKRSLSMEELIHPEEYVANDILHLNDEDDEEEGDDPMSNENLSPAEAAAMRVIMGGADALPEDATPAQKEFAEEVHKQAFASMGIPAPEDMGIPAEEDDDRDDPADPPQVNREVETPVPGDHVEYAEETFEVSQDAAPPKEVPKTPQPAPIPVVHKEDRTDRPTTFKPMRRGDRSR